MSKWLAILFFLFFSTTSCYAWNALGHLIVAKIAYDKLQPKARTQVDKLAAALNSEYPNIKNFVQMAPWPDTLHAQKIESYTHWHYIDNAFSVDGTPIKNLNDTDNVIWAINQIEPVVVNNNANLFERARFLAFLIHFIGDVHQPLHTVSRISAKYPNGDNGGNLFYITEAEQKNNGGANLHRLWDNGIELFAGTVDDDHINAIAKSITAQYPEESFGDQVGHQDPKEWAEEGMKIATQIVYNTSENQVPNEQYKSIGEIFVKQRIALAGYRLAYLLNHMFG